MPQHFQKHKMYTSIRYRFCYNLLNLLHITTNSKTSFQGKYISSFQQKFIFLLTTTNNFLHYSPILTFYIIKDERPHRIYTSIIIIVTCVRYSLLHIFVWKYSVKSVVPDKMLAHIIIIKPSRSLPLSIPIRRLLFCAIPRDSSFSQHTSCSFPVEVFRPMCIYQKFIFVFHFFFCFSHHIQNVIHKNI